MKTRTLFSILIIATICAHAQLSTAPTPTWKVTLKVVDDAGNSVAGAKATVGYLGTSNITGLTDTNGIFIASHRDKSFALGFIVTKDGYYVSRQQYELGWAYQYNKAKWNPIVEVLLKKIIKPIPMYARRSQIEIPVVNKPVGFDFMQYDWVAPYGKGKESDIIFETDRRWDNRRDFDSVLNVTFSTSGDGLLVAPSSSIPGSSGPRISVTAPLDGYQPELQRELSNTPDNGWKNDSKDQNYYFRVRTVLDVSGKVKSALYGKIYGDFALDPINSKTTWILFTYYLNPTPNDRNVEFDPKKNLVKDLKPLEGVSEP